MCGDNETLSEMHAYLFEPDRQKYELLSKHCSYNLPVLLFNSKI